MCMTIDNGILVYVWIGNVHLATSLSF